MSIITVSTGDCVAHLAARVGPQFDSVVCDPPYHLVSGDKRDGRRASADPSQRDKIDRGGFMGQAWDGGDVAFRVETWRAVFDQMKPGAHLIAFGGTRTYHRMVCAIEDAGFEIRDQLAWLYGSGFPKSHDVSKGIDKAAGAKRKVVGRRPDSIISEAFRESEGRKDRPTSILDITAPAIAEAIQWDGWGSALKPALEPIVLARKPLSEKTIAANVLRWGVGALNIDGCRISAEDGGRPAREVAPLRDGVAYAGNSLLGRVDGSLQSSRAVGSTDMGRWPANVVHDGSEEVLGAFPDTASGLLKAGRPRAAQDHPGSLVYGTYGGDLTAADTYGDSGSAARFFYSAKAGPLDRLGSEHPTIKPVDLMRWLCRLVTPPGGLILDPFAGSGTTGIAAMAEGFNAELIDLEPKHVADIERKLALLRGEGRSRFAEQDERKAARPNIPPMPLFGDTP